MQLSSQQLDTLTDLLNVGARSGVRMLNLMLDAPVSLSVPTVRAVSIDELVRVGQPEASVVSIDLRFGGPWQGVASLDFSTASASTLVDVLTDEEHDDEDLDSWRRGTLTEVGNIVLCGLMGAIGDLLDRRLEYDLPIFRNGGALAASAAPPLGEGFALLFEARFAVSDLSICGNVAVLFQLGSPEDFGSALERLWGEHP